jgi:hypothetical protein
MPYLYAEAIETMTRAFRRFEAAVTPPELSELSGCYVFRFPNKGIHEALIQKLARYISGLNACSVLLQAGYTQEVGVLFRTLDEMSEDIAFLATAVTNGAHTDRHTKYLAAFYAEAVFSRPEGSTVIKKPDLLPRKQIRSHTHNTLGNGNNNLSALSESESISAAYSGYVHAASENVMDMYGGAPPHFHLNGMARTPIAEEFYRNTDNYIFRGLLTTQFVAKAFNDKAVHSLLEDFLSRYAQANGHQIPAD